MRRSVLLMMCAAALFGPVAQAQDDFPRREPITIVTPYAAGAGSDFLGRRLGEVLRDRLGQQVIVVNMPGSGGIIAAQDFAAVVHLGGGPYDLVAPPSLPARNMEELVALSRGTQLFYASSGIGGASHLAGELLKLQSGVKMSHTPFRGGGPAVMAVLSNQPPLLFGTIASSATHIRSGGLRAIGVTGDKRAPQLPNVPTLAELGVKGYNVTTWDAFVVPAATPKPVIDRLNAAVVKVIRMPEVSEKIREMGYTPTGSSAHELAEFLKAEAAVWARVIQEADVRAD